MVYFTFYSTTYVPTLHKASRRKLVINIYLTYYVHLVGTKEVIDCKNAWSGKLKTIIY